MKYLYKIILLNVLFPFGLLFSAALQTETLIFLFDHAEKNMVASMLNYARVHDESALDSLDFRIVFMGPVADAMSNEPFKYYSDKLIHYKQLGIEEEIDHQWQRSRRLSQESLEKITQSFDVQKKVWVPVSSLIFEQLIHHYQENTDTEILAMRDNPNPEGDTDYFLIANQIQSTTHKVIVPSLSVAVLLPHPQKVTVVGHGPLEEWCEMADHLNKEEIFQRIKLDSKIPTIVYAGVYGESYEESFKLFLDLIPQENMQILVVPHPRFQGAIEKKVLSNFKKGPAKITLVNNQWLKTIEALSISDVIFIADASSTMVLQANALNKKVLYVNPSVTKVSESLCEKKLIHKVSSQAEFIHEIQQPTFCKNIFELLGIPKNGSRLLWEELLR